MKLNEWLLMLWPLYPTRKHLEAAAGDDPAKREKLDRLAASLWRLFRATAIGSLAAWVVFTGTLAGLAWTGVLSADDRVGLWRLVLVATGLFGSAVLVNYPWQFREQGSRWVRWLVLAVGVPSLCVFVAGFFGLL